MFYSQAFTDEDTHHTGTISGAALHEILNEHAFRMSSDQFSYIWSKLPKNAEGKVDYRDFLKIFSMRTDVIRVASTTPPQSRDRRVSSPLSNFLQACVYWKDSIPHTSWTTKAISVLKLYLHWQVCLDTFWSCLDTKDEKFHTFPFILSRKVLFKEAYVAGGFVRWARHSVAKRQKRRRERAPFSVPFSRRLCCSDALPTLTKPTATQAFSKNIAIINAVLS